MYFKESPLFFAVAVHANNNGEGPGPAQSKRKGRAWEMMRKMGYTEGRGIGANEQGRAEPIAESTQIGRLGLGMKPASLDITDVTIKWTPGKDQATSDSNISLKFGISEQEAERAIGTLGRPETPPLERITGLSGYMDNEILEAMLRLKSRLDSYDTRAVTDARSRCNPYESLRSGQYQNRYVRGRYW